MAKIASFPLSVFVIILLCTRCDSNEAIVPDPSPYARVTINQVAADTHEVAQLMLPLDKAYGLHAAAHKEIDLPGRVVDFEVSAEFAHDSFVMIMIDLGDQGLHLHHVSSGLRLGPNQEDTVRKGHVYAFLLPSAGGFTTETITITVVSEDSVIDTLSVFPNQHVLTSDRVAEAKGSDLNLLDSSLAPDAEVYFDFDSNVFDEDLLLVVLWWINADDELSKDIQIAGVDKASDQYVGAGFVGGNPLTEKSRFIFFLLRKDA